MTARAVHVSVVLHLTSRDTKANAVQMLVSHDSFVMDVCNIKSLKEKSAWQAQIAPHVPSWLARVVNTINHNSNDY